MIENKDKWAREIAAQCWCDKETENKTMDVSLAMAVAKRIAFSYAEGRKAEREYNWKAVAKMCGVNPYTHRPCIDKVEEKFWCPVCVCAGKIRGGQDGK